MSVIVYGMRMREVDDGEGGWMDGDEVESGVWGGWLWVRLSLSWMDWVTTFLPFPLPLLSAPHSRPDQHQHRGKVKFSCVTRIRGKL